MSFGHGGPTWGPDAQGPDPSQTPDWDALAADAEASRARRRRWMIVGGAALATALIGAMVAIAVVTQGGDDADPTADSGGKNGATTSQPNPTFSEVAPPPPPDPRDYISDPEKDTAPITAQSFFPNATMRIDDRTYARKAVDATENCAAAAQGKLRDQLSSNNCEQMLRATFVRGDIAVTVGVAVFASDSAALDVADQAEGNVQSLVKGDVPKFCRGVVCRPSAYAMGRYTYFTIAGYTDNTKISNDDAIIQAGEDARDYTYERIMDRGRTQASAAVTAPPE